jgi:hypothetical protein
MLLGTTAWLRYVALFHYKCELMRSTMEDLMGKPVVVIVRTELTIQSGNAIRA